MYNEDWEAIKNSGIVYVCLKCGADNPAAELGMRADWKCIICGYKVLRKARPPVARRLKAV